MQPLTDPDFRPLTVAQVLAILQGPSLSVRGGLELVDENDTFVADISDDLVGGQVQRSNYADIHGTVTLQISRALAWGSDRVRPYMTLTDRLTGLSARWNQGVYVLSTPDRAIGEKPETYQVTGADKLYLLDQEVGDSYGVASGSDVLAAATAVITAAGAGGAVLFDMTASGKTLPADKVYPLTSSTKWTWLTILNDLLATVGYRGVWCDWNGAYRSEPYQDPKVRGPEFAFTADDPLVTVVSQARTLKNDLWSAPNWWRFIADNWPTTPVEGNGQYTVQNLTEGPASQAAPPSGVGRVVRKTGFVSAADQASLQALGDQTVSADKIVVSTMTLDVSPFPPAWHFDVYSYLDSAAGGSMKVMGRQWTLDLTGADGQHVWEIIQ